MRVKRFLVALALILLFTGCCYAQDPKSEETIQVPKSMLSQQQLAELATKDLQERVKQYGNWVGIGHEIGVAVNEGFSAVTTQSNAFAQTSVGKWTMFVIVFKVIGTPIIGILFALVETLLGLSLWFWSIRKWLPKRVLDREIVDPGTGKVSSRFYTVSRPPKADEYLTLHYLALLVILVVAAVSVFANL